MKHRIFIAINLTETVKKDIGDLVAKLKKFSWPIKWESPGKVHITLRFLGDIEEHQIDTVREMLSKTVANIRPFDLKIKGFVAFPNFKFPKVLGLKVIDSPDLFKLQSLIAVAVDKQGIGQPEGYPFTGHITIGRLKPTYAHFKALSTFSFETQFAVPSVEVMESVLKPAGSEYTVLYGYQLVS